MSSVCFESFQRNQSKRSPHSLSVAPITLSRCQNCLYLFLSSVIWSRSDGVLFHEGCVFALSSSLLPDFQPYNAEEYAGFSGIPQLNRIYFQTDVINNALLAANNECFYDQSKNRIIITSKYNHLPVEFLTITMYIPDEEGPVQICTVKFMFG